MITFIIAVSVGSMVIGMVLGWLLCENWHEHYEGDWPEEGNH